jgi:hypothetical protein
LKARLGRLQARLGRRQRAPGVFDPSCGHGALREECFSARQFRPRTVDRDVCLRQFTRQSCSVIAE